MHHNMFLVVPVVFLRVVAGTPPLRYLLDDRPDVPGPLPLSVSPSPVSSLTPVAPGSHTLSAFSQTVSQSDRALTLVASVTTQVARYQTVARTISPTVTNPNTISTPNVLVVPFATHLSSITGLHTESLSSQQHNTQSSSSVAFESTNFVIAQPSVSSSAPAATSTDAAPKIRFAIIGVLAGVPALTILGFLVTSRWRRTRLEPDPGMNKPPSDRADLRFNSKEGRGARFSSFFGVSNTRVVPSKNRDGRNLNRPAYASSIHSTAGLAGIGAHRGESANSAAPMIRYISVAEIGLGGEFEKKANFDNPFGTPPPVCAGFITAPSRVSPHLPHTPPPQLINLPPRPTATQRDYGCSQLKKTGFEISHPMAIQSQNSASRFESHLQDRQPEKRWEGVKDPLPAHVHCRPLVPGSLELFPPDIANHACIGTRNHKYFGPSDSLHSPISDIRVSIAVSVYDGIASPGPFPSNNRSPEPIHMPSYLVPSPRPEQTPVLPYLTSPVSRSERPEEPRQGVGPVIVVEAASPTFDSESEYAETDAGDEAGGPYMHDGSAHARRTGLIGSPHGFVAPSSTFSSVSLYSISRSGSATSSSTSTAIPHESSASSALAFSSSSSSNSSVTTRALMLDSMQETRMRNLDTEGGKHPNLSLVPWTQSRKDFNKPDLEGLRGIAF